MVDQCTNGVGRFVGGVVLIMLGVLLTQATGMYLYNFTGQIDWRDKH